MKKNLLKRIPKWVFKEFDNSFSELFWADIEYGDAKSEIAWIAQAIHLQPHAKVLDMGCGDGRHTLEFAKRKFFTTGVDCCDYPLKKASQLIQKSFSKYIAFEKGDIRTFRGGAPYDLVTLPGNTFVCFTKDELSPLLHHAVSILKPSGYFVFDTNYYEKQRKRPATSWMEPRKNRFKLTSRKFDDKTGVGIIELIALADGKISRNVSNLYFPRIQELLTLCKKAGFTIGGRFGSLTGDPFVKGETDLTLVLRKC